MEWENEEARLLGFWVGCVLNLDVWHGIASKCICLAFEVYAAWEGRTWMGVRKRNEFYQFPDGWMM
jgi:hypothetical protein